MMAPAALAILMTMFPGGAERTKALACWSGVGGLGATAALLIGGALTGTLGWEWIFFINLPVAAGMLIFGPVLLTESRDTHPAGAYDASGALAITLALISLIAAIVQAPAQGWTSGLVVGLLLAAVALTAVFIVIESRSSAPLVPLRIFRSRLFAAGNLTIALPAHGSYLSSLFPGLLLLGLGIGSGPVAAISAALSSANEEEAGVASGINTAFFQIGGALGTAVVSGLLISQAGGSSAPAALIGGLQAGFTACVVFAAIGLCVALTLLRPRPQSASATRGDRRPGAAR